MSDTDKGSYKIEMETKTHKFFIKKKAKANLGQEEKRTKFSKGFDKFFKKVDLNEFRNQKKMEKPKKPLTSD